MLSLTTRIRYRALMILTLVLAALPASLSRAGDDDDEKNPFERWEPVIQKFEQQDARNPPPKHAHLFVGSSSIRKWDLDESFPEYPTINRGFGGSEIADSIHFADRIILKHRPDVVLLYAGDNDIARGKSAEVVTRDFRKFVDVVRKKLPQTKIVFIAIKPSLARWKLAEEMHRANQAISAICGQNDALAYVDIYTPMLGDDGRPRPELFLKDGLHLNEKGYALWASLVRPLLGKADSE